MRIHSNTISLIWKWVLTPAFFYTVVFYFLTFPEILKFKTHFFAERGDGLACIWGVWWLNKALLSGQSFWFTDYLHFPHGTTLLAHSLAPWKGILSFILLPFLSMKVTYNSLIVFSFAATGVTCYWLVYRLTSHVTASLVSGSIFTFSSFHFAHLAGGHMHMISLEWFPIFVLCWIEMLRKPSWVWAVGGAVSLWGNLYASHYYFLYAFLFALIYSAWEIIRLPFLEQIKKINHHSFVIFLGLSLGLTAYPIFELVRLQQKEYLVGVHASQVYVSDALALFIPGAFWRWAHLTEGIWSKFSGTIYENSVSLGLSLMALIFYAGWKRKKIQIQGGSGIWLFLFFLFIVLSLGPYLHIGGKVFPNVPLLYEWIERVVPGVGISGLPARFLIVSILAGAVLAGGALSLMLSQGRVSQFAAWCLIGLLVVEYWPAKIPTINPEVPDYVQVLKSQPKDSGGVMDWVSVPTKASRYLPLYYQTIHEKPMVYGVLSRIPTSIMKKYNILKDLFEKREYRRLCQDFGIRYLVIPPGANAPQEFSKIYQGNDATILDLGSQMQCKYDPQAYEKV